LFAPYEGSPYQGGRAAVVSRGGETLGTFGELDPALRQVFDLPERRVVLGEFDAAALLAGAGLGVYRTLSRYPPLTQDLAIVAPNSCRRQASSGARARGLRAESCSCGPDACSTSTAASRSRQGPGSAFRRALPGRGPHARGEEDVLPVS
jgi:hypothetical protein